MRTVALFCLIFLIASCELTVTDEQMAHTISQCNLIEIRDVNNGISSGSKGAIMSTAYYKVNIEKDFLIKREDSLNIKRRKFKKVLEAVNKKEVVEEFHNRRTGLVEKVPTLPMPQSLEQKFDLTYDCYQSFLKWLPFDEDFEDNEFTRELRFKFVQGLHMLLFYPMVSADDMTIYDSNEEYPEWYLNFVLPINGDKKYEVTASEYNHYLFTTFKKRVRDLEYKDSDKYSAYYNGFHERISVYNSFSDKSVGNAAATIVHEMLHKSYWGHDKCGEGDNKYDCDDKLKKPYGASGLIWMLLAQGAFLSSMPGENRPLITESEAWDMGYYACRKMVARVKDLPAGMFDKPDDEVAKSDCGDATDAWMDKLKKVRAGN